MPLTFTPDETEERKRRSAAALAAGGQQAIGYGMDALSTMEALAKQKRAEERQAGLDERAAWQSDREFLRLQQKDTADRTRQTEQDRIAAEDRTLKLERQKAEDERAAEDREIAAEDRTLTLQANRDKQRAEDLPKAAASIVMGDREINDELITDIATSNGLDYGALVAEVNRQKRERTMANAAADLSARDKESQIAERDARTKAAAARARATSQPRAPVEPKKSPIEQKQKVMRENASKLLDIVEQGGEKFDDATTLPSGGRVMGPVRDALTGWLPDEIKIPGTGGMAFPMPALEEGARTEARGAEEAYNAMLFPVLGRPDAPADQETKRLAPLMFSSNDTPEERRRKIALGRAMLNGTAVLPDDTEQPVEATPVVDEDTAAAMDYFGG